MDFQKETIKTLKTISKANQTHNYDWDIIVPDSKPDVATIISTEGRINVTGKEIMQDRAVINGNVKINILYISADETKCVKNIESVQNFNCVLELKNLRQNMTLDLDTFMNKISANLINSRKINVASVIEFCGNAFDEEEISYIEKVNENNIAFKAKEIKTLKPVSCFEKNIPFNENIEVPVGKASVSEILKLKPDFLIKEIKNATNKMIVRGNLIFSTVYACKSDAEMVQFMSHEIPVNDVVECDNISENSVLDYDVGINNFNYVLKNNNENEMRIIKVCGEIIIKGKVYEELCICPIVDMYSLSGNLKLEKNEYLYDEILNNHSGQFLVKDTVTFNDISDIQKVLLMDVNTEIETVSTDNDYIRIKGLLWVNVLYLSKDNNVLYSRGNLPFEYNMNSDGASKNTLCDLKIDVDSFSYNIISSDEIELRTNLNYKLRIKNSVSQELVEKIELYANDEKIMSRGITVFFCDGNEKIWDIAKKYKTTVENIIMANDFEEEPDIRKGMKLLIP